MFVPVPPPEPLFPQWGVCEDQEVFVGKVGDGSVHSVHGIWIPLIKESCNGREWKGEGGPLGCVLEPF